MDNQLRSELTISIQLGKKTQFENYEGGLNQWVLLWVLWWILNNGSFKRIVIIILLKEVEKTRRVKLGYL